MHQRAAQHGAMDGVRLRGMAEGSGKRRQEFIARRGLRDDRHRHSEIPCPRRPTAHLVPPDRLDHRGQSGGLQTGHCSRLRSRRRSPAISAGQPTAIDQVAIVGHAGK